MNVGKCNAVNLLLWLTEDFSCVFADLKAEGSV